MLLKKKDERQVLREWFDNVNNVGDSDDQPVREELLRIAEAANEMDQMLLNGDEALPPAVVKESLAAVAKHMQRIKEHWELTRKNSR